VTLTDLLARVVSALDRAQVPYMLSGSVASSAHGTPRSTLDLDIVLAPTRTQLLALMGGFPSSHYYADEEQALEALAHRSQFKVIDFASGWKVDFVIAEDSDYGRGAVARRIFIPIAGINLCVAAPEDVLIAQLRWAKLGGSDRQLQDAAGILGIQGSTLDRGYLEHWVHELHLESEWQTVCKASQ
jgi:hypothetical protein